MTLEEKAEQYVIKNVCENCNHCQSKGYMGCDTYRFAKKTYIDSAKENGVVWHNLREDLNDLPNDDRDVLVKYEDEPTQLDNFYNDEDYVGWGSKRYAYEGYKRNGDLIPYDDTIAWCEIPQFKE